jgi:hypothetical protein
LHAEASTNFVDLDACGLGARWKDNLKLEHVLDADDCLISKLQPGRFLELSQGEHRQLLKNRLLASPNR